MISPEPTKALARWIADFFQSGIHLTAEHHRFMLTTFGTTDPEVILRDHQGCEIDSLLQMIFYPDQDLRIRYEYDWGEDHFSPDDIEHILAQLARWSIWGKVIPGLDQQALSLELSVDLLRTWIERLKITWRPPLEVVQHLTDLATPTEIEDKHRQAMVRTYLRHAPIEWHGGQIKLIARYLSKASPGAEGYLVDLSALLSLLVEMGPGQAVDSFLSDQKAHFFQSLCKAETFEVRHRNQAMEVLIMQGCRAAYGNVAHWRRQMAKVDRLSRIMFGKIPDISLMECNIGVYKASQLP
jgi:hypothetical protein